MSLSNHLAAKAAAQVSVIEKKNANTARLAAAYDASGYAGSLPWIVRAEAKPQYDGDVGSLHWREVGPDELAALVAAFPPIERAEYKHGGCRHFKPGDAPEDAEDVRDCDGLEIEISGGRYGDTLRAQWSAMVGDVQTGIHCDLRRVPFLHPRTSRRAVTVGGEFIRFEGPTTLHWPEGGEAMAGAAGVYVRTFGMGDQSHADVHLRGNVVDLVAAWETEANRRGEETRAAFLADYVDAVPSADAVAAKAEEIRADYDAKRGGLRAGTLAQTAALALGESDAEVARKHWPAYAAHHGIEARQGYFDHYAWACAWLKRCDLYTVPVTDAMRAEAKGGITADVYTYGARWL